jgi:hypothetical protein
MGCCRREAPLGVYELVCDLFCAGSIACVLYAMHRIARGILLGAEIKALGKFEEAYTPEEREALIHKIKVQSLRH